MAIRLVKTMGGNDGSPASCRSCGSVHFIKAGIAWHCSNCGTYFPTNLSNLKKDFNKLTQLQNEFRAAINKLENLVKE